MVELEKLLEEYLSLGKIIKKGNNISLKLKRIMKNQ